jgi:hypothetical protein
MMFKKREQRLVLEFCLYVDWLVTQDPGAGDLGVLEQARLRMNDLLMAKEWTAAEELGYAILLYHAGSIDPNELTGNSGR